MAHFEGKTAIITGGASGIGRAIGEALAGQGAHVVLADINEQGARDAARAITESGGQASAATLDVTNHAAVSELLRSERERHGRLDYVFNNAGVNVCGELRDHDLNDWYRLIDVNLKGVVHGVHEAYAIMREQGGGHIVNTASLAGLVPAVGEGAYGATKHAVVGLSMALRAEARHFGVNVSVVCPGVIGTPMVHTGKYINVDKDELIALLPGNLYSVDRAARVILRGVQKNRGIITVTAMAKIMWWLYRWWPAASTALAQPLLKRFRTVRRENALPR